MKRYFYRLFLITAIVSVAAFGWVSRSPLNQEAKSLDVVHTTSTNINKKANLDLPLVFVPNQGQWADGIQFLVNRGPMTAGFHSNRIDLKIDQDVTEQEVRGVYLRMDFEGADNDVTILGQNPIQGSFNYLIGNNAKDWVRQAPGFRSLLYKGMYSGIDLRVREANHQLEYDLILEPNADLKQVLINVDGVRSLSIDNEGALVMHTDLGDVRQSAPKTWYQHNDGTIEPVASQFRLIDKTRYGFEVPNRNSELALVIDPALEYSTFIGGTNFEDPVDVKQDEDGRIYVAGSSASADFPTTPGAFLRQLQNVPGGPANTRDVVVFCLDPSQPPAQQLIYSTYIGGDDSDAAFAMDINDRHEVFVGGATRSTNYPVSPGAFQTSGKNDAGFITHLSADGSRLLYSTYLGGLNSDVILSLDEHSEIVAVTGVTDSSDFPVSLNANKPSLTGRDDAFAVLLIPDGRLAPSIQLFYSTYLGGDLSDIGHSIDIDESFLMTVAGTTAGSGFPVTANAFDSTFNNVDDGFVTQLDPFQAPAGQVVYSTFLGGSGQETILRVDVAPSGVISVAGPTNSSDFPVTPGAFLTTRPSGNTHFITRLDPSQVSSNQNIYTTFFGAGSTDILYDMDVDGSGQVTVSGFTQSPSFPTTPGALKSSLNSPSGFVSRLDPAGSKLVYSTLLGGIDRDDAYGLTIGLDNEVIVAGTTRSSDFPVTPNAFSSTLVGTPPNKSDMFVTHLNMLPNGVDNFGQSTPTTCLGPISMGAIGEPKVGNQSFTVTTVNAPRQSGGLIVVGEKDPVGLTIAGITVFVDLTRPHTTVNIPSDQNGYNELVIPIPATHPVGDDIVIQTIWGNPSTLSCTASSSLLSASNALEIIVQP